MVPDPVGHLLEESKDAPNNGAVASANCRHCVRWLLHSIWRENRVPCCAKQ